MFEGVAGSHRDPNAGAPVIGSGDRIFWTFAVERQLKGDVPPVVEVATSRSGASCGVSFQEGVRYRVFARYDGTTLITGLGSGTRPVTATTTTTATTVAPTVQPRAPITPSGPRPIALTG